MKYLKVYHLGRPEFLGAKKYIDSGLTEVLWTNLISVRPQCV